MTGIQHDENGPFVRAARATVEIGQTETVYALKVEYRDGTVEYWNVSPTPLTDEQVSDERNRIYRRPPRLLAGVEQVSRRVTISATDWEYTPAPAVPTEEPND